MTDLRDFAILAQKSEAVAVMKQKPDADRKSKLLRGIPSVERILAEGSVVEVSRSVPRWVVVDSAREVLAEVRRAIVEGRVSEEADTGDVALKVRARALAASKRGIRKVINATGVVIHTNLGRSILARTAAEAALEVAESYSTLEYDLERGTRSSRTASADRLLARIVGSEDAFAVNNNAGAVLIALNTLAFGRGAIVSRGELVEIGGSFRLPDVMEKSGSRLVEVGTTNRTRLEDYEGAIAADTAAILKVHHSNFAMKGFVESPPLADLVGLAHGRGIIVIEDLGSGALVDLSTIGVPREPMPQESISAGVDVVTFSGDKLLGGPQAGLIAGKGTMVAAMKNNPLARVLRLDKSTLAALEETLRIYLGGENVAREIPTLAMLGRPLEELERRAEKVASLIASATSGLARISVERAFSQVGGGSLPLAELETRVVSIVSSRHSADRLVELLRESATPIIARIVEDKVYLDLRTVEPSADDLLARQVVTALGGAGR